MSAVVEWTEVVRAKIAAAARAVAEAGQLLQQCPPVVSAADVGALLALRVGLEGEAADDVDLGSAAERLTRDATTTAAGLAGHARQFLKFLEGSCAAAARKGELGIFGPSAGRWFVVEDPPNNRWLWGV